jgi:hypothetical protein
MSPPIPFNDGPAISVVTDILRERRRIHREEVIPTFTIDLFRNLYGLISSVQVAIAGDSADSEVRRRLVKLAAYTTALAERFG